MARAIDKRIMLDLIIEAKKTDPETGPFSEWLAEYLVDHLPTLTPPNEPRMINADKLAKRIAGHSNYHGDSILAAIYCAAEGKENDAPIRPIETPPNEPLTCDGCIHEHNEHENCNYCKRASYLGDYYYPSPPEGEEDTNG